MDQVKEFGDWLSNVEKNQQIVLLDFVGWLGDKIVNDLIAGRSNWKEQVELYLAEVEDEKISQIVEDQQEENE